MREYTLETAKQKGADTVVLGPHLEGHCDLVREVILPLRRADLRVVLLPGPLWDADTKKLVARALAYQVFDIVYDPVSTDKVVERLLKPASMYEALGELANTEAELELVETETQRMVAEAATGSSTNDAEVSLEQRESLVAEQEKVPFWRKLFGRAKGRGGDKRSRKDTPVQHEPVLPNAGLADGRDRGEHTEMPARRKDSEAEVPGLSTPPPTGAPGKSAGCSESGLSAPYGAFGRECGPGTLAWPVPADDCDLLTGCLTRRGLQKAPVEFPCSVVFIDLDGFKEVNDWFGHNAGDEVLSAFGRMLRQNLRDRDLAVRWGGDEFVLILPGMPQEDVYRIIQRIRQAWEASLPAAAAKLEVSFSAGMSWCQGREELEPAINRADQLMYQDKRARKAARLRGSDTRGGGVLVMGEHDLAVLLRSAGLRVVVDPRDARVCVSSVERAAYAPKDLPLVVAKRGSVSDMAAVMVRPDAVLAAREDIPRVVRSLLSGEMPVETGSTPGTGPVCPAPGGPEKKSLHEESSPPVSVGDTGIRAGDTGPQPAVNRVVMASGVAAPRDAAEGRGRRSNLYVIPGRGAGDGVAVPEHGVVYVVCPGEPPLAGHIAASVARQVEGCALVCASGSSTGALALGMRPEDLVLCDWRIPGSEAPVRVGSVTVWPVDPGKFLDVKDAPVRGLVDQIRGKFPLVVVDCGGDLGLCTALPRGTAVVVIRAGGDHADWLVSQWARDHGGNALTLGRGNQPVLERAGNGFVLRARQAPGDSRFNKEA